MTKARCPLANARQNVRRAGVARLTDAEVLALTLGGGFGETDALGLAAALLESCGGLHRLSTSREWVRLRGVGEARAARVAAAIELGRRLVEGPVDRRRAFRDPRDAANCFRARLADLGHEVFCCLFLDTRHRMLGLEPLFRGTIDGAAVYPREVVKQALAIDAAAVILGHNHPSGDCEPSEADRQITRRVAKALALVDVRLLDHLIVSRSGYTSLAERGWI